MEEPPLALSPSGSPCDHSRVLGYAPPISHLGVPDAMQAETKRALQQIKSSITGVGKFMRPSNPKPTVSARAAAAAEAEAAAALLGERHTRARLRKQRKGRKGRHEGGGSPEEPDTTPLETAALAAASHAGSTPRSGTPTSYLSEGESEEGNGCEPATPREKSGSGPTSPLAGPSGSGGGAQSLSPSASSSMSFTARLFSGMTSASGSAGKAAPPPSPPRRPASPRAGAPGHEALASPGPDARGHQGAFFPVHLPPELAGHAVVEEVFENQRLQVGQAARHGWRGGGGRAWHGVCSCLRARSAMPSLTHAAIPRLGPHLAWPLPAHRQGEQGALAGLVVQEWGVGAGWAGQATCAPGSVPFVCLAACPPVLPILLLGVTLDSARGAE